MCVRDEQFHVVFFLVMDVVFSLVMMVIQDLTLQHKFNHISSMGGGGGATKMPALQQWWEKCCSKEKQRLKNSAQETATVAQETPKIGID